MISMSAAFRKVRNSVDVDYARMKFRLLDKKQTTTKLANSAAALGAVTALAYGAFAEEKIIAVFIEKAFSLPKNLLLLKG